MLTTVEETIINSMARTLHVCAYADAHDNHDLPEGSPGASHGEDWMDVAPDTSDEAKMFAAVLAGRIQEMNGKSLLFLIRDAAIADGINPDECYDQPVGRRGHTYCEMFGHYLAMQSLGHGVSWFDDHEKFPLKTPLVEFYPSFA
jgi:hypothetical protein